MPAKKISEFEAILEKRKSDNIEKDREKQFENAWSNFNKRWKN